MVISVIAILMTLTLQVVGGMISQARHSATQTTLNKIQGLLNSRSQAFNRLTMRKGFLPSSHEYQIAGTVVSGNSQLQNTLAIKLLEAKYFPQYYTELFDQVNTGRNLPGLYPNLFNAAANFPAALPTPSQILYDFLTQENVLGTSPIGLDTFSSNEVQVPTGANSNGLPQFVDGWGNPLRFYRWPTRLFRSQGQVNRVLYPITSPLSPNPSPPYSPGFNDVANAQLLFSTLPIFTGNLTVDLARDPDDPLQNCFTVFQQFEGIQLRSGNNAPFSNVLMPTPVTYHILLVVSAGPDGVFGMYPPDDISPTSGYLGAIQDLTALNDDIISLNIRAGGK